ncbi:response regulator [Wenzhouxiangella sp. EGI_FJ10409]|uniref:response regulator n=1 Tax=Wenzhouxiangella sp. EGI_FJ10409 TaxID=3243767 RepID=UPI0035E04C93
MMKMEIGCGGLAGLRRSVIPQAAFLLLLLFSPELRAYSEVRFEHLSLEHGLAQSAVQDMVSDELGYMWFGTQYGLSRYDGYVFRNFRHDPEDPNSLSNSRIKVLLRGRDGAIWIGTRNGLNRLDPETLEIRRIAFSDADGIRPANDQPEIRKLAEDGEGNLVVQTLQGVAYIERTSGVFQPLPFEHPVSSEASGVPITDQSGRVWLFNSDGLWRFDPEGPLLRHVLRHPLEERQVRQHSIASLPSGLLALGGRDGVLLFDPDEETVVDRIRPTDFGHADDWVPALVTDPAGHLWLLTRRSLVQYKVESGEWHRRLRRWYPEATDDHLDHEIELAADPRGFVWIGLPEGVGLYSPDSESIRLMRHDPTRPSSLTASPWSALYDVYVDDFGTVWVGGGLGGLSRFSPQSARFEHVMEPSSSEYFGVDNVVRSVLETSRDDRQLLWTGLTFSGIRVWEREAGAYDRSVAELHALSAPRQRLPDNSVWELAEHPVTGEVWVGTSEGMAVLSADDFEVQARHPVELDGRSTRIKAMVFSDDGRMLWAAGGRRLLTFEIGPEGRELRLEHFESITPPGADEQEHGTFDMIRLRSGELLVGMRRGVILWDPVSGELTRNYPAGQPGEHPRNFIFGLAQTADERIWLGSEQGGLAHGALDEGRFTDWHWHDRNNGLPDNTVYAILPSERGRLWLSSNRGLIRFNPRTGVSRHFTLGDGLQGLEFNNTVASIGQSGLFYFGGINGVNVFRPDEIELHPEPPRVYLQRAEVGGDNLPIRAGEVTTLNTSHDRNSLVLEFVGLHFVEPDRNRYAYRLAGVDEDWVESDSVRRIRYPDLPPGEYRFLVRAANSDGVWSEPRELLRASVASPPWLTLWAYSLYAAAAALLIIGVLLVERRRRRRLEQVVATRTHELREQKDLVDRQAAELAEVLDTRTTLFANISHEFRTPLTLVEAGIDRLARNPDDTGAVMSARRYLRRLLRLVDQLLNLSRLQSSRDLPRPDPWSIDQVVAMTVEAFRPLAEQKGIELELSVDGRWSTQCQQADVERILLNLIGNALKYCPSGSRVEVRVGDGDGGVLISVSDNGPGIEAGQKDFIFERFNRMPAHEHGRIEGAGIGLTLVREAARSNGGHAEVVSEPGEGAEFRVWLPAWRGHMEGAPVDQLAGQRLELELETLAPDSDFDIEQGRGEPAGGGRFGTALVAEDNQDLRKHLAEALSGDWQVLEAGDGAEALQIARERLPDVVVSDIMMPRLDGLELLRRLRQDVRTSHLPVLLLTARQDDATRLQGYTLSADDFLAKPFNPAELRLRLRRMIDIRTRVQTRLWRQLETSGQRPEAPRPQADSGLPDLSERDEQLLERVRGWLEANFDDPEAGVAELAEFVAVEQRTLQRKLKALTGRTPAAHLQSYRLECARRLLVETSRSIQDIAYSCGFSSPQYFSRVFTQQAGTSPSNWRRQQG